MFIFVRNHSSDRLLYLFELLQHENIKYTALLLLALISFCYSFDDTRKAEIKLQISTNVGYLSNTIDNDFGLHILSVSYPEIEASKNGF